MIAVGRLFSPLSLRSIERVKINIKIDGAYSPLVVGTAFHSQRFNCFVRVQTVDLQSLNEYFSCLFFHDIHSSLCRKPDGSCI